MQKYAILNYKQNSGWKNEEMDFIIDKKTTVSVLYTDNDR